MWVMLNGNNPLKKMQALVEYRKKPVISGLTDYQSRYRYRDKEDSSISPMRQHLSKSLPCTFIHKTE